MQKGMILLLAGLVLPLVVGCTTTAAASGPEPRSAPAEAMEEVAVASEEVEAPEPAEEVDVTKKDETGTDPRSFSSKFMPYYRYMSMQNNLRIRSMALFGMVDFEERVAFTYELPVGYEVDYSRVREFKKAKGTIESGGVPPGTGGVGAPPGDLDSDGDTTGMGDLILRMFYMPKAWDSKFDWGFGPKGEDNNLNFMVGAEGTFPTATEEVLGGEAMILSPMFTVVIDTPTFGFLAAMSFFDFDVYKDDDRDQTRRYRGRWFLMQPLSKPGPGFFDGWYLLPELQPIYDLEESDFSLWIGPEIGKIVSEGRILYAKPGWGTSPEGADRKFTFELGLRWFF